MMSSTRTAVFPSTSPMMSMTSQSWPLVGPPLVDDGQVRLQAAGELPGPDHPSHVGGHHHQGAAGRLPAMLSLK